MVVFLTTRPDLDNLSVVAENLSAADEIELAYDLRWLKINLHNENFSYMINKSFKYFKISTHS